MKKSLRKLVLRGETIRALAGADLARVAGGADAATLSCPLVADSGRVQCPAQAVVGPDRP